MFYAGGLPLKQLMRPNRIMNIINHAGLSVWVIVMGNAKESD